jgi:hypothetical protein
MTEIAWLVKFMTQQQLTEEGKKACIERIGEVEERINARQSPIPTYPPIHQTYPQPVISPIVGQPPLSQAQLRDMAQLAAPTINIAPSHPALTPHTQLTPIKEVITSQSNGGSTRGPNKMRGRL